MQIWTYALIAVFALSALFIYLLPAVIAFKNRHPKRFWIALLDVVLGVTVFGWIAAILWATAKTPLAEK
ncbi:MAG: superinfection immunity protein [Clostridia bacterium]|nr:superinfection immunity protein [Clostridia bacterium]